MTFLTEQFSPDPFSLKCFLITLFSNTLCLCLIFILGDPDQVSEQNTNLSNVGERAVASNVEGWPHISAIERASCSRVVKGRGGRQGREQKPGDKRDCILLIS
jgi:hypothetical protein